jgi:predicted glycoside hydrolase/deacetylase ChbG (UPF0249 family)
MPINPVLKRLGFSSTDRLVIIHADDIGMCQASIAAFTQLWEYGTVSSGALMMPCSWAPAAAEFCRTHPGVDMGVHATLTSEWNTYRWGPLSTRDPHSGLLDEDGFFHRSTQETQANANPEAVMVELQTQIDRALTWGIDVTHLDTHMGAVAHPKFFTAYYQAAVQHHIAVMIPRGEAAVYQEMGLDVETAAGFAALTSQLEEQGLPLVDAILSLPLDQPEGQIDLAKKLLGDLPAGLTHFIIHPCIDSPELRAITPDWKSRVANYETFMSREIKEFLKNSGIHVTGYRALRNLIRSS